MKDLNEELQLAKDGVRAAKARENSLREELESLNKDLQRSHKSHNKLQGEKESLEDQLNELKKKVQRLSSGLQVRPHMCFFTPVKDQEFYILFLSNSTSVSKALGQ